MIEYAEEITIAMLVKKIIKVDEECSLKKKQNDCLSELPGGALNNGRVILIDS